MKRSDGLDPAQREAQAEESDRRLAERDRQLHELFDEAPCGYHELDTEGRVVRVNRTELEMLGYTAEEMIGHPVWEFTVDQEASRRAFAAKIQGAMPVDQPFERVLRRKDGSAFPSLIKDRILMNGSGEVEGIRSTVQDITERKQAEEAVRENERRYRSLFENMLNGFAYCRMLFEGERPQDFIYLEVNSAFEKLTGLKHVVGKKVTEAIPGIREAHPELFEIYGRVSLTGHPEGFEIYLEPLGAWLSISVYSPEKGYFVAVFDNITERKRAEEERTRLSMAVEQAAESIVITDRDGAIVYVNPAFERVSGYSREEVLGKTPRVLKSGRQDAAFYRAMWETILRGEVWTGHFLNRGKDGTLYEEEAVISPIRDPAGELANFVAVKRDVTRETALEAQLRQAQKMEAVGTLAGGVAHDFNNLLTSVIGFSQLALMEQLPPLVREYISKILDQGNRAASLISQLLTFSRHAFVQRQPMNLLPLLQETIRLLRHTIPESVAIRLNAPGKVWTVNADATQMQQVIMNLSINAGHALPGGGDLALGLENVTLDEAYCQRYVYARPGRYVCLSVRDTGMGMTPEVMEHIFEPFFTTKEMGRGTGLGLSSVYGIVKTHEGHVNVYSEVGRGTEFKVYIPALVGEKVEPSATLQEKPVGGTETVLVVEDQPSVLVTGRMMLERLGYTVLTALNGEEALSIYRDNGARISLVLTDMVMPEMSGEALFGALRQISPNVRVLMMSGYSLQYDLAELRARGIKGFVQKPFDMNALSRAVRQAIDELG